MCLGILAACTPEVHVVVRVVVVTPWPQPWPAGGAWHMHKACTLLCSICMSKGRGCMRRAVSTSPYSLRSNSNPNEEVMAANEEVMAANTTACVAKKPMAFCLLHERVPACFQGHASSHMDMAGCHIQQHSFGEHMQDGSL